MLLGLAETEPTLELVPYATSSSPLLRACLGTQLSSTYQLIGKMEGGIDYLMTASYQNLLSPRKVFLSDKQIIGVKG